eukprot:TRINITY_DN2492_c0_g4_i1.p1 TRINITY_DN2492_c0_g4~~TRINITY_DN2492_c0_g4_i1.p1  ORF type:complete len:529 (+),score=71.89 TRINITY_DN2492_c0_g4_i1:222-1808(+)
MTPKLEDCCESDDTQPESPATVESESTRMPSQESSANGKSVKGGSPKHRREGEFPNELSNVAKLLCDNSLDEYCNIMEKEGYDDVEDLLALSVDDASGFNALVPKAGHRRKLARLLQAASKSKSPSPQQLPPMVPRHSASPTNSIDGERLIPRRSRTTSPPKQRNSPSPITVSPPLSRNASPSSVVIQLDQTQLMNLAGQAGGTVLMHNGGNRYIFQPIPQMPAYQQPIAAAEVLSEKSSTLAISAESDAGEALLATGIPEKKPARQIRRPSSPLEVSDSPNSSIAASQSAQSGTSSPLSYLNMQEQGRFKVIVVGDAGTGKTSFIHQLVHQKFAPNTKATIGLDWREKQFKIQGGYVTIQFWDISGQERFANVTRAYYQGAHGAIVCFDRSNPKSLETVSKWKKDIDSKVFVGGGTDGFVIPCLLLANKCDLHNKGSLSPDDLQAVCRKHRFISSFETSAKLNYNVQPAAEFLMQAMMKNSDAPPPTHNIPVSGGINYVPHAVGPQSTTTTTLRPSRKQRNKGGCCQ